MKITYNIERQDYVAAQTLRRAKGISRISRTLNLIFGVFYIVLVLGSLLLMAKLGFQSVWKPMTEPLLAMGVVFAIYYWAFPLYVDRRNSAQDHRLGENLFTAEISDEGVQMQSTTSNGFDSWDHFIGFLESESVFLVSETPRLFVIFPKRASAPGEADQFRELLKRKLSAK